MILNFGSINVDHVYNVTHISRPGETVPSSSYQVFAGGKGANQTAALARAGAEVAHAGMVGPDGGWLIEKLAALGADTRYIATSDHPTGHAVIQVDDNGENSILLHAGANKELSRTHITDSLSNFDSGDILLLQNEISEIYHIIHEATARGLRIFLNPAPFEPELLRLPLHRLSGLILNQTEAAGLDGSTGVDRLAQRVAEMLPAAEVLLTLGARGAEYRSPSESFRIEARKVEAVDATGAGDTFIGYYLAERARGADARFAMERATSAAAICVSRRGAMDSIPTAEEVDEAVSAR